MRFIADQRYPRSVDVPDLFSSERRWCWTERAAFAMLLAVALFAGFRLAWWGLALYVITVLGGFAADLTRHRAEPSRR